MILELYVRNDEPHYSYQTDLDGETYGFELRWNTRDSGWYLTIRDAEENVLLAGIRLVVGFPLLRRFRDFRLPPGELEAVDTNTTGQAADPGLADLGQRVLLVYTSPEDLPEGYGVAV
jgi:hypothetical protein